MDNFYNQKELLEIQAKGKYENLSNEDRMIFDYIQIKLYETAQNGETALAIKFKNEVSYEVRDLLGHLGIKFSVEDNACLLYVFRISYWEV